MEQYKNNKKKNVAHLSDSIRTLETGVWDVGIELSNSSSSHSTSPNRIHHDYQGTSSGQNRKKESRCKDKQRQQQSSHMRNIDSTNIKMIEASKALHNSDDDNNNEILLSNVYLSDEEEIIEDGTASVVMLSNKKQQYCNDIVVDILIQETEYEQRASSSLVLDRYTSENDYNNQELSTTRDNFTTPLQQEDSLEHILETTKTKWRSTLVKTDDPDLLSMKEFDSLWQSVIIERVYKALNYTPIPNNWSFLIDEKSNPEKYKTFFDQCDSYSIVN
jgi:hypothetical protein